MRRISYSYFIILSVLTLSYLTGCHETPSTNSIPKLVFTVDTSLISNRILNESLEISYCVPYGMMPESDSIRQNFQEALNNLMNGNSKISYAIKDVYYDSSSTGNLIVAQINVNDGIMVREEITKLISEHTYSIFKDYGLQSTIFRKDELEILQFRMIRDNRIYLKLIWFNNKGTPIQFDYSYPVSIQNLIAHKIESSIGSINLINNNGG